MKLCRRAGKSSSTAKRPTVDVRRFGSQYRLQAGIRSRPTSQAARRRYCNTGSCKTRTYWYEWDKGTWVSHRLIDVDNGHSLALVDFNRDGNLDVFIAEMRLNCGNPGSKICILLGDGAGKFTTTTVAAGFDNHESKIADLDGNGTLDILGKPYDCGSPGLDVWLNFSPN